MVTRLLGFHWPQWPGMVQAVSVGCPTHAANPWMVQLSPGAPKLL